MNKKKILVLSDHPLSPSGVGTQTKYMIEALLKTNRYKFVCLGGAMKHNDYTPVKVEGYGEDWIIFPIDGYGSPDVVRSLLQKEKPDVVWFMTDPRFYEWLWEMENEIRAHVPLVYYHVWDNFPAPEFNGKWYRSTDEIVCISKVTHACVQAVTPDVSSCYLPHAVPWTFFRPANTEEEKQQTQNVRDQILGSTVNLVNPKKKIFFCSCCVLFLNEKEKKKTKQFLLLVMMRCSLLCCVVRW